MSKWIWFNLDTESSDKRKTDVWHVLTKEGNSYLGAIQWFGRWRGYSFFPYPETIYEKQCLRDIADFLEEQNRLYKQKK